MTESALQIAVQAVRLYAETHPRPPHVTQRQAAAMLDVSAPTIAKLIKARKLSLNEVGLIPIGQVDAMLAARVEV